MRTAQSKRLLGLVILIPVFLAFALTMFAWPTANLAPRDLPLGLAGPGQATRPIAAHLQAATSSGFDFHQYGDAASARQAIENREIYAAVVAAPSGVTLLVASAGSAMVAQLLSQAMTSPVTHRVPRIVDVVPTPLNDPHGVALGSSILPLVLGGAMAGGLVALLLVPGLLQAAALALASLVAGLVATAIAQGWLGVLEGSWLANASVFALTLLAISTVITGLRDLLGYPGIAVGGLLMVFVGNPFSGVTSAPELLPRAAGVLGQLLPPGAGGNLLRSTAFFGGRGGGAHLVVLLAWAVCGYAAIAAGTLRARQETVAPLGERAA